jgi:hypothetical protein
MSARFAAAALIAATIVSACTDQSPPTAPSSTPAVAANRAAHRSARAGALHIIKNCASYHGGAHESCTIRVSSLAALDGATIVYTSGAASNGLLDTDVTLFAPGSGGSTAFGHCTVNLATGIGECRIRGGTGTLSGLRAKVAVSYVGGEDGFDYAWDGRYRFTGRPD